MNWNCTWYWWNLLGKHRKMQNTWLINFEVERMSNTDWMIKRCLHYISGFLGYNKLIKYMSFDHVISHRNILTEYIHWYLKDYRSVCHLITQHVHVYSTDSINHLGNATANVLRMQMFLISGITTGLSVGMFRVLMNDCDIPWLCYKNSQLIFLLFNICL